MASYSIQWKASAAKELRKLPRDIITRILAVVDGLASAPRPDGVRKLVGSESTYRIRVGEYRVVYNIFDERLVIEVIRVRDRKDAYR
ncbi:MAG TPA: type II toxin-antitoxin system RelE/ParE family toxin [Rectinemataceae bacterium]|nr:type II toxin-antitoxin system RelE/ParE family toxin [Rectinemataceae bacterium]